MVWCERWVGGSRVKKWNETDVLAPVRVVFLLCIIRYVPRRSNENGKERWSRRLTAVPPVRNDVVTEPRDGHLRPSAQNSTAHKATLRPGTGQQRGNGSNLAFRRYANEFTVCCSLLRPVVGRSVGKGADQFRKRGYLVEVRCLLRNETEEWRGQSYETWNKIVKSFLFVGATLIW